MPVVAGPSASLEAGHCLGLAIKNIGGNQNHCKLLYRLDNGQVRLLHLAFHFDLRDEEWRSGYWCAPVGLDIENQIVVAAFASAIANAKPSVPYGFDSNGLVFDGGTGELLRAPAGKGLTCATFVLAVLRVLGFQPLDGDTWPIREEDDQWQAQILRAMESAGASLDHIDAVASNGQSRRYRPEEVVGTSATDSGEWSIEFPRARDIAQQVLADMAA